MSIIMAFLIGGLICLVGQLIMELTPYNVTPAHILVGFVTGGALLSAVGLYGPLVKIGGAGATIPISGFGHTLAQGTLEAVQAKGFLGAFTGGVTAGAAGIAAAVVFGFCMATLFNPKG
ncbi:MAG: stage V sporulation protein AE [Moorella humiferrea]|uniref:SpoVA protein n=1 Tax=Neomoorella humiferrea TaxID=676965 RepID=A0A2T0AW08_9FIRM|nr:stage V sporulation protein AE [Moorella humiferrea]MBE3573323.1 stage V sporulation protein AE [Moorella humiferrea]PRR74727.1 SpoVA protein [Moorella humiferrea]